MPSLKVLKNLMQFTLAILNVVPFMFATTTAPPMSPFPWFFTNFLAIFYRTFFLKSELLLAWTRSLDMILWIWWLFPASCCILRENFESVTVLAWDNHLQALPKDCALTISYQKLHKFPHLGRWKLAEQICFILHCSCGDEKKMSAEWADFFCTCCPYAEQLWVNTLMISSVYFSAKHLMSCLSDSETLNER